MDIQAYIFGARKLYRNFVARGQGQAATDSFRNLCVDRADTRIEAVILPWLGWQPGTKIRGGKRCICKWVRISITSYLLDLEDVTTCKGFSEAGCRTMDRFFCNVSVDVLIAVAEKALQDERGPEASAEAWRAFIFKQAAFEAATSVLAQVQPGLPESL